MDVDMKQIRKLNALRESLLATGYNGEIYGFLFIVADCRAKSCQNLSTEGLFGLQLQPSAFENV